MAGRGWKKCLSKWLDFSKGFIAVHVLCITGTKGVIQKLLYLNKEVTACRSRFS
jgi:hypothetical protein